MKRGRMVLGLLWLAASVATGGGGEKPAGTATKPGPTFTPGAVTRIDDPQAGYKGHFLIYVPTDYTPDRTWPVIFSYHGLGGRPTVEPFRALTDGKRFIIVGMPYIQESVGASKKAIRFAQLERQYKVETEALTSKFIPYVLKHLRVDKRLLLIGGFSRGGYAVSMIAENTPGIWAGVMILGGGRQRFTKGAPDPKALRGRAIFVGVGETDNSLPSAEKAAEYYRGVGANVTLEIFKGMAHTVDRKNKALRDFLLRHGVLLKAYAEYRGVAALIKSGKAGRAYAICKRVGAISTTDKTCVAAAKQAKVLSAEAEKKCQAAEKAAAEKRYPAAARALTKIAADYAGSEFGDRAGKALAKLKADPTIQGLIVQAEIDAKADAAEALAKAAEKAKQYARAIKLYEHHVATFPKATRHQAVKAHLAALKADKAIQAAIVARQSERDCRTWLGMADNYITIKRPDKARAYLKKILGKYPKTAWADKARERLKDLGDDSDAPPQPGGGS